MRLRLVLSTLVVALVVVVLLGFPLMLVGTRSIEQRAEEQVRAQAHRLGTTVDLRLEGDEPVDAQALAHQVGEGLQAIVDLPGAAAPITVGRPPEGDALVRTHLVSRQGASVTVLASRERVDMEIRRSRLFVGGAAVLAIGAAVGMAVLQARRLVRPLIDLAETAERLGSGYPRPRDRRYGVPELDRVARILDQSAERVARMLAAERQFAADASHQLRTPLTALSMRLEEIAEAKDEDVVREEAAVALAQVERLTDVVDRLLTYAQGARPSSAVPVVVDQVIRQQVHEWRPAYVGGGRRVAVTGARGLRAVATPGALAQVLATLLENALAHGAGTVTVHTRTTGTSVVLEVSDEGTGVPDELGTRVFERLVSGGDSTGLGLAVARDLAEADGGRLELLQRHPPVFALFLTACEGAG